MEVENMPVLSRFYGIVIRMYFQQAEHQPPHIHAIYGDEVAAFNVETGNVIEGKLPQKADSMVREWIGIHQEELMHIWNTQEFKAIAPLE